MKIRLAGLVILSLFFIAACKKTDTSDSKATDIYVAGTTATADGKSETATYWKNGIPITFNSTKVSAARGIAVNGNDVYIVGYTYTADQSKTIATLWKNGTATPLADSSVASVATAIVIQNNNIFITGEVGYDAVYWKNGTLIKLAESSGVRSSVASSIAVNGSDIYVAGYTINNTQTATYWKNGSPVQLTDETAGTSVASSIAVNGNDVYVAGTIYGLLLNKATVWKNGISSTLANTYQNSTLSVTANAIALNGSDIYTAGTGGGLGSGTEYGSTTSSYFLMNWKNGIISNPSSPVMGNSINVSAIALNNHDVYVTANADGRALYIKNNIPVTLASGPMTGAYGIAVVAKAR